jgi:2,4-dienoyl-CoA reductase-like NADH-dependent reductase (Old Yellow Enzyme family)
MMGSARLTIGDTRALAMMVEKAGVNAINVSVGSHATEGFMPVCPAALPHGYNLDFAEEIKKVVSIPVFGNGKSTIPMWPNPSCVPARLMWSASGASRWQTRNSRKRSVKDVWTR